MPVVTVRALAPPSRTDIDACLAAITVALSGALGIDQQGVWAQWITADAMRTGPSPQPFDGHCPIVTIRARAGRTDNTIAHGLGATAMAVATALRLPLEDIWVHWEDVGPGRVFAGGALR